MSEEQHGVSTGSACYSRPLTTRPLSGEDAEHLANVFKAIADPVRLRLLSLIASHEIGEVCVCDLTDTFDLAGPTISHHLKVLRQAGLIEGERRGTWIYYRVRPERLFQLAFTLAPDNEHADIVEAV